MRRYTSILMLGARGVVMPLIAVLLLMGAAETGLVFRGISGGWNPEWFWSESRVVWAYRAALVLLAAACCVHVSGLGGSQVYYTMHRLRLSEWTVTVLLGLCYAAAFVVLWAVQAGILTAVTAYTAAGAGAVPQAVFLISWNDAAPGPVDRICAADAVRVGNGHELRGLVFLAAPQQLRLCRADCRDCGGDICRLWLPEFHGGHLPGSGDVRADGMLLVFCGRGGEPV